MKKQMIFRYSGLVSFSKFAMKAIILVFIIFISIFFIINFFSLHMSLQDYFALIFSIVFLALISFSHPFFPDIKIDDESLTIESFWKDLRLTRDKIVKVEEVNIPFNEKIWLVKVKGLTPFHRVYSLFYSATFSFEPGFLIHAKLKGHEILINELMQIRRKADQPLEKQNGTKQKAG